MTEVPLRSLESLCEEMEAFAQSTASLSASMTFDHIQTLESILSKLHLEVDGPVRVHVKVRLLTIL